MDVNQLPKNINQQKEMSRWKLFYISLCLFFVLGAMATGYIQGEQLKAYPDMSWRTPKNFVGYFNNWINQKVNPTTLGDVLIT